MGHQSEDSQFTTQIVIVDEDQFQLKLLSHQLSMVGYKKVTAFNDGQAALNYMAGQVLNSTLVILDLSMPNMDGLEFLQKLQKARFTGALLLVSGEDERVLQSAETLASSYGLWVQGHLSKPVQLEQIQKYLKQLDAQKGKYLVGEKQHIYEAGRLKQAIEFGELLNFYQPKVLLATGELVGVEALVRWEHPDDGLILPGCFIDLAEENELIGSIAQQVLRNALADHKVWKDAGINITVAVNISMHNFSTRDFISYLENELLASGVSPQDLILEVTESELMKGYSLVLDTLTRLRLRRVNLSIDGFGTHDWSMTQLRDIPFNELKIDRGVAHSACDDASLHGIVDGCIRFAKDLGIKTVAEGVENEADWSFLGGSGCDLAQGFFIGRPMRVVELREWKTEWAERYAKIAI
jgi:EAL domain-containing protein (putative c-di-GMP-specific phosphodiesterase class I)